MKLTCLFLSFFLFHAEHFFNLYVFTLLFNQRHLYNSITWICVWTNLSCLK